MKTRKLSQQTRDVDPSLLMLCEEFDKLLRRELQFFERNYAMIPYGACPLDEAREKKLGSVGASG